MSRFGPDDIQPLLKPDEGLFCILHFDKVHGFDWAPDSQGLESWAPGPNCPLFGQLGPFFGQTVGPRGPICLEA